MIQPTARIVVVAVAGPRLAPVRAVLLALLLVVLVVLPATAGNSGPTHLSNPSVSPGSGTPTTKITFSVTYRSRDGSAPDYVRVVIGNKAYDMRPATSPESWKDGVRYVYRRTLGVGSWKIRFESLGHDRFQDTLPGPTVSISRPAPQPEPTPKPESKSAPAPTPTREPAARPTAAPAPTAAPDAVADVPDPLAGPGAPHRTGPAPTPPPWGTTDWAPKASPDLVAAGGLSGGGGPGGQGGPGDGASGPGQGGPGGEGDGAPPDALGGPPSALDTIARLLPTAVVTTGGVSMLMAFLVFGKRRRDGMPTASDAILGAAAASGLAVVAGSGLVPGAGVAALPMPTPGFAVVSAAADADAHLPRWRRPSLLEARKADPLRQASVGTKLTFDPGSEATVSGLERRLIRYRLVSLLDLPDEVRGAEIGTLDEGDEVVLLEKRGTYWRVLCPNGSEGWLHKMVLGDVVIDSAGGGDSWTAGDEEVSGGFEDVLRAYADQRRRLSDA